MIVAGCSGGSTAGPDDAREALVDVAPEAMDEGGGGETGGEEASAADAEADGETLGPPDPLPFEPEETRDDGALRLTYADDPASDQNACFSPDGSFLVFTRFENGYNDGPAHLMRLDLDGSEPVQLTSGDQDDVDVPFGCFSRATGRVVFASDREEATDFWTIVPDPDAPDMERLTHHGELPIWIEPVWSPDGRAIAFERNVDTEDELAQRASVWRIDDPWTAPAQLTNLDGALDDRLPSWSPDGTTIVFQRRIPPSERWEAYLVPAAGGEPTNLSARSTEGEPGHDTDLSWSPDGRFVASSTDPDGIPVPSVYLLPVAGGPMIRVTLSDEHEDGAPCVSPNGLWVAFESHRTSDEDSPSDIWIIRTPEAARPGS
jgi:Tol biopolymer transport system component